MTRTYLAPWLGQHPDIAEHGENIDEEERMGMWRLLTLAKRMGIDPGVEILRIEEERQSALGGLAQLSLKGEPPFDLTFTFLGITRKAQVVDDHDYDNSPWPIRFTSVESEAAGMGLRDEAVACPNDPHFP